MPDPIKTISVRMEAWLHKKIRILAAGKEQSVGAWIREAIMEKMEKNSDTRQMHYILIPKEVLGNPLVSAQAKVLYGIIHGLHRLRKRCIAENKALASIMGVKTRSIQYYLNQLENNKFIFCHYRRNKYGFCTSRVITPLVLVSDKPDAKSCTQVLSSKERKIRLK